MGTQGHNENFGIACYHWFSTPNDAFYNALTKIHWYFHQKLHWKDSSRQTVVGSAMACSSTQIPSAKEMRAKGDESTPLAVPENIQPCTRLPGPFLDMVVMNPSETRSSTLPLPRSQLSCVYLVALNKSGLGFLASLSMSQPGLLMWQNDAQKL